MKMLRGLLAGLGVLFSVTGASAVNFMEVVSGESPSETDYRLTRESSLVGDVVVFTAQGKPLLPDLAARNVPGVANEMSFTVDSPEYPWNDQERATIRQVIADFYPVIKKIYGNPAFAISVNIRKNPTIDFAGMYHATSNEIVLRDLDTINPLVHEMIHALRDDLAIGCAAYEEGMARAAEIAAFSQLTQYPYDNRNHSYSIDVFYDQNNEPGIASQGGDFFRGFPNPFMKYQQAGYAWGKVLVEDPSFLARFNAEFYALGYGDPTLSGNIAGLKGLAGKIARRVENDSFQTWYDQQYIFNETPASGYQTLYKGDTAVLYLFYRDGNGFERPMQGVPVSWNMFSCEGTSLLTGSGTTSDYGWIGFPLDQAGYRGKVRIEADFHLPDQTLRRTVSATTGTQAGIFGIADRCSGEIDFVRVSADGKRSVRNVAIENGAFTIPELESVAGKFTLVERGGEERTITKDASSYFVILGTTPPRN